MADTNPQYSKFSPMTVELKKNLKQARLNAGLAMMPAATKLGISRKQLEDIETIRNYGCHIDVELVAKCSFHYGVPLAELWPTIPQGSNKQSSSYYLNNFTRRPRERGGAAA